MGPKKSLLSMFQIASAKKLTYLVIIINVSNHEKKNQ